MLILGFKGRARGYGVGVGFAVGEGLGLVIGFATWVQVPCAKDIKSVIEPLNTFMSKCLRDFPTNVEQNFTLVGQAVPVFGDHGMP